jgi:hypothetical protein
LDENIVLGQLEELAESLEIEVRHEPIKKEGAFYPGGLCRLEGKYILILNPRATTRDKIQALAKAVNRFDLSQVYLRPGLREFLESFPEQRNPI